MKILNLGCGTKTTSDPRVVNVDWSIYLRVKRNRILRMVGPLFFNAYRLQQFRSLPDNILFHDLSTGIPFESASIDVVYHSHLLEHLDRPVARSFLAEVRRVLKPGGIQRIVVPDLERLCREYLDHVAQCERDGREGEKHDEYIASIIEQCVRKEALGTSKQTSLRRRVENLLLGDARSRGETHQWMYDRTTLTQLLTEAGYRPSRVVTYNESLVLGWNDIGLDLNEFGNEHKPGSLYVEAQA